MASADYWLCDWCGCKTFYDANLDYDNDCIHRSDGRMLPSRTGDAMVICVECAKDKEVIVRPKSATETPSTSAQEGEPT